MKLGFNFFFLISCFPTGPCCLLRKLSWPPNQSLPKYHIQFGECIKIFKNGGHIIHTVYFKNFQMLFRNLLAFYNLTCPLRWFATSNSKLIVPWIYSGITLAMHLDEEAFTNILVVFYLCERILFLSGKICLLSSYILANTKTNTA